MTRTLSLADMEVGCVGTVRELVGRHAFIRRLEAMGIRRGTKLTKTSGAYLRGPVTVRAGNVQIALGYGIASRVMIDVQLEDKGHHGA